MLRLLRTFRTLIPLTCGKDRWGGWWRVKLFYIQPSWTHHPPPPTTTMTATSLSHLDKYNVCFRSKTHAPISQDQAWKSLQLHNNLVLLLLLKQKALMSLWPFSRCYVMGWDSNSTNRVRKRTPKATAWESFYTTFCTGLLYCSLNHR